VNRKLDQMHAKTVTVKEIDIDDAYENKYTNHYVQDEKNQMIRQTLFRFYFDRITTSNRSPFSITMKGINYSQ
jgi:hypothetical protein